MEEHSGEENGADVIHLKPEFADKRVFILDLDGTVYRGKDMIQDVDKTVRKLMNLNKTVIFLTNNATKTRENFKKKLENMNIPCMIEQVISSGFIAAKMLFEDYDVRTAFIIGTDELVSVMESVGIQTLNNSVHEKILYAPFLSKDIVCDAVVCAMDVNLTYAKIRTGMELVNRGAELFATNGDKTFPESKQVWPGAGMTVAAMQACVGRPPKVVFGKPNIFGVELIFRELNRKSESRIEKSDAIVIGDRLETDIWQANNAGVDSLFVETGINTRDDIPANPKSKDERNLIPEHVLPHIKDIFI